MSFRDLPTNLTPRALDELKHSSSQAMRRTADLCQSRGRQVIELAFGHAHRGLLEAQTEDEVERIQRDFAAAILQLKGLFDAFDRP